MAADRPSTTSLFSSALDVAIIVLASQLAYFIRFDTLGMTREYWLATLAGVAFAAILFPALDVHKSLRGESFASEIRHVAAGWLLVGGGLVIAAGLLKLSAEYSRLWFGYWLLLGFALLPGWRYLRHRAALAAERRAPPAPVVLVGGGSVADEVRMRLDAETSRYTLQHQVVSVDECAALAARANGLENSELWIATGWRERPLLEKALRELGDRVPTVRVVPDLFQFRLLNHEASEFHGLPLINISSTPLQGNGRLLKSLFDRVLAAVLIVLLSPVLLLIAIGVKLSSPGPVLFRQRRHGFFGQEIEVLKFRSMKPHAEPEGQVTQATENDDRVTPFGRFLRRTSLDELPQLFNVLRGDMSLVGPRPHAVEHNDFYSSRIPRYMLRHRVKPGITGWAQVHGWRGETSEPEMMEKRIEYDLYYIQNWSLWLDVRVLMMTPFSLRGV